MMTRMCWCDKNQVNLARKKETAILKMKMFHDIDEEAKPSSRLSSERKEDDGIVEDTHQTGTIVLYHHSLY
jgi:hypothetical protein